MKKHTKQDVLALLEKMEQQFVDFIGDGLPDKKDKTEIDLILSDVEKSARHSLSMIRQMKERFQ